MTASFGIAGGSQDSVRNILARVTISDGTTGYGEGAPYEAYNGETQDSALTAAQKAARALLGRPIDAWRPLLELIERELPSGAGSARAALGMAVLDAWTRRRRLPLYRVFGGAETRLRTDVTVTLSDDAAQAARRIKALGVAVAKVKVGRDVDEDAARARAVHSHGLSVILDANQGFTAAQAVRLVGRLGFRPILFEQPVPKSDWDGLREVERKTKVPVAADESASSRQDVLSLARRRVCSVVNVKLMKCGLLEAWDIALIARAAGLRLMIGGNVESRLAMGCAAHFAAGLGGFEFVDLDTPLWLAREPMRGLSMRRGGLYELSGVAAGIGVVPTKR